VQALSGVLIPEIAALLSGSGPGVCKDVFIIAMAAGAFRNADERAPFRVPVRTVPVQIT